MRKDTASSDIICSQLELKQFANNEHIPTVLNFHSFISSKSKNKYAVVEQRFIFDLLDALKQQETLASNSRKTLNKEWNNTVKNLHYQRPKTNDSTTSDENDSSKKDCGFKFWLMLSSVTVILLLITFYCILDSTVG